MAVSKQQHDITPSGFFVFRTPLLPFDEFLKWSEGLSAPTVVDDESKLQIALNEDRARLRQRLKAIVQQAEVREAIFVASPSLESSLEFWFKDPESERGQKVERALVRYFVRMSARPTPFGLFAGSSMGQLGKDTQLAVEHNMLNMPIVAVLCEATS